MGPLAVGLFWVFAVLTGVSALSVALARDIVRAAAALLFCLGGVAGLYLLLNASFLAAVQGVVYVGGTLVLIIFGVMLTSRTAAPRLGWIEATLAGAMACLTVVLVTVAAARTAWPTGPSPAADAGVESLGQALADPNGYLAPFELISVLLLAVMLGAAYLARGRRPEPDSGNRNGGAP